MFGRVGGRLGAFCACRFVVMRANVIGSLESLHKQWIALQTQRLFIDFSETDRALSHLEPSDDQTT